MITKALLALATASLLAIPSAADGKRYYEHGWHGHGGHGYGRYYGRAYAVPYAAPYGYYGAPYGYYGASRVYARPYYGNPYYGGYYGRRYYRHIAMAARRARSSAARRAR